MDQRVDIGVKPGAGQISNRRGVEIRHRHHHRRRLDQMDARDAGDKIGDILISGVHHDVFRRAGLHHCAVFHDGNAVADANGLVQIVGDEDSRFAQGFGQLAEFILQLAADQRIQRGKRLIHQDDFRVGCDGAGKADALLHAARQFARIALHPIGQTNAGQGIGRDAAALGRGHALHLQPESRVFQHGAGGNECDVLKHHADGMGAQIAQVLLGQTIDGATLDQHLAQ
ncbi:MAG: hypothetical protein ACD_54C00487G0001 [uncultured bacterium]|nr:MAG: hypothetical protein ACD_54C00487G0001 [uncultured bacterium]